MNSIRTHLEKDLDTCRELLYLFHPDIPNISDERLEEISKLKDFKRVLRIEGDIAHYGYVSLALMDCFCDDSTISYSSHIEKIKLRQDDFQFDMWRMQNDCLSHKNKLKNWCDIKKEYLDSEACILRSEYTEILTNAGYRTAIYSDY